MTINIGSAGIWTIGEIPMVCSMLLYRQRKARKLRGCDSQVFGHHLTYWDSFESVVDARADAREDLSVGTVSHGGSVSNTGDTTQIRDLRLKPRVSVMIPTLNEARNLPYVLNTVPGWVDEVIVVDGRSTDDTLRIAKVLRPDIKIIYEVKPGKGAAMKAGFEAASGDFIIALDADGSMDGAEIGAFRDALDAGADYVKGTRFGPGGGSADITKFRRFGDGGICLLIRLLFGGRYTDATYGYIGVRAESVEKIGIDSDGFEVETLIGIRAHRAGLRTTEVPCFETSRIHGTSNLHALRDGIRIFSIIVKERFRRNRHRASKTRAS